MSVSMFRWNSYGRTDVGKVRTVNEDAFLNSPEHGVWVVADGMGGHQAGDVASKMIVDALRDVQPDERLSEMVNDIEERLLKVNQQLLDLAQADEAQSAIIGSTVVVLVALGGYCACLWAGDSRVYRISSNQMEQISRDHSGMESLLQTGEFSSEDEIVNSAANVITRAVGAANDLVLDVEALELHNGERFLLCSDGLSKELHDSEIAALLVQGSCEKACDNLIEAVLKGNCRDNVTALVIQFDENL